MNIKKKFTHLYTYYPTLTFLFLAVLTIIFFGVMAGVPSKKVPVKVTYSQCTEVVFEASTKTTSNLLPGETNLLVDGAVMGALMLSAETQYRYLCTFTYLDKDHRARGYQDFPADRVIEPGMIVMVHEK